MPSAPWPLFMESIPALAELRRPKGKGLALESIEADRREARHLLDSQSHRSSRSDWDSNMAELPVDLTAYRTARMRAVRPRGESGTALSDTGARTGERPTTSGNLQASLVNAARATGWITSGDFIVGLTAAG
jgi:hypothetical protein